LNIVQFIAMIVVCFVFFSVSQLRAAIQQQRFAEQEQLQKDFSALQLKALALANQAISMRRHKTSYSFSGTAPARASEVYVNEQLEAVASEGERLQMHLENRPPRVIIPDSEFREIGKLDG
jgi:hypothetical protein